MSEDYVTVREAHSIAQEAADRAVRNMVREMGVDADDFNAMEEFRATVRWAQSARSGSEQIRAQTRKGLAYGAAATFSTGVAYFIWRLIEIASKAKGS